MRPETISLSAHDDVVDYKTKKAILEGFSHAFSEQQVALDSYQQENVAQFKSAYNPYAAALADVFGLEA